MQPSAIQDPVIKALSRFNEREASRETDQSIPRVLLKTVSDWHGHKSLKAMPEEKPRTRIDYLSNPSAYKLDHLAKFLRFYDYANQHSKNQEIVLTAIQRINKKINQYNHWAFYYENFHIELISQTPPKLTLGSLTSSLSNLTIQTVKKEIGCGIANPGINACYLNSTLQALRLSSFFNKFITVQYETIKSEQAYLLPSFAQDLVTIAELSPKKRNRAWTALMNVKSNHLNYLQNILSQRVNELPEMTKNYLTLFGLSEQERNKAFQILSQGKNLSLMRTPFDLQFLINRLKSACLLDKAAEKLKEELSAIFAGLKPYLEIPEYVQLIDTLVFIQQQTKQKSSQKIEKFLNNQPKIIKIAKNTLINLFSLSQVQQQKCLLYPLIIQLRELYNTIEDINNQTAVSKDVIQSIRQLARFAGLEAAGETSQEDACSFFCHIADTVQIPHFAFSSHTYGKTEQGHFFALGLGQTKNRTDIQTLILTIDRHLFITKKEAPSLLPIQLKRFDNKGQKNNRLVIPSPILEVLTKDTPKTTVKYALNAIVIHQGETVHSGHYFTCAPRIINEEQVWVEYNDNQVFIHKCPPDSIPTPILENGYLFFYEKINPTSNLTNWRQ